MKKLILTFVIVFISSVISSQTLEDTRWIIQESININGVIGDYNQDEINKRIGKIIEYYQGYIIYDGKKYLIQKTTTAKWTRDDLYNETRGTQSKGIYFEDIGFTGSILNITQYNIINYRYSGEIFGFIDSEHGVTEWNGVWYLLDKL